MKWICAHLNVWIIGIDNSVLVLHLVDCFVSASSEAMIHRIIKQWDDKYPGVSTLGVVYSFVVYLELFYLSEVI